MSEWNGTAWEGSIPPSRELAKAETGTGVASYLIRDPLERVSHNPRKRMLAAQAAYHSNPWIGLAESTVTRKFVGLPWHLEDGNDEEYDEDSATPSPVTLLRRLIEKPQDALPKHERQPGIATRRGLWSLTSRHVGLCGVSHWYLDQRDAVAGLPLSILYINPARMFPAEDDGGRLLWWILDPKDDQGRGGTRLELDEVLTFYLDPPDFGSMGHGLYERMLMKARITDLADRHAAYVLGTGGRIAGFVSPKEGMIPEEPFKAMQREFRNVAEADDAAKRLTILQGPVDFTKTAADPNELGLTDLASMERDDILSGWGVPPSQAGVPAESVGLNSGETKKYDEATLMQGAVHDRVVAFRETLQYGLLDRASEIGLIVELEIEEPEFDDRAPAFQLLADSRETALTNAQRWELIGLSPTGKPEIDDAILLPSTIVEWTPGIKPEPTEKVIPKELLPEELAGKADKRPLGGLRRSVETKWVPKARTAAAKVLDEQKREVQARLRGASDATFKRHHKDPDYWLPAKEDQKLIETFQLLYSGLAEEVIGRIAKELEKPSGKADPFSDSVISDVLGGMGERIVGINKTTRNAVASAILRGFAGGLSPAEMADSMDTLPAFDEYRSELVARTETMFAYNTAALRTYESYDVTHVEALDGDQDEECAARHGQIFTIGEASGIQDHPNGTLDWAPVLGGA